MPRITAILDANILFSPTLRDLFIEMSCNHLFHARWTDKIHDEWMRAVVKQRPDIPQEALLNVKELMDQSVPDCLIEDFEPLIESLSLPDENDRHILAAAIKGKCHYIVTRNIRDFPAKKLKPFGISAILPHEFIRLFEIQDIIQSSRSVISRLEGMELQKYNLSLRKNRLKILADQLGK